MPGAEKAPPVQTEGCQGPVSKDRGAHPDRPPGQGTVLPGTTHVESAG